MLSKAVFQKLDILFLDRENRALKVWLFHKGIKAIWRENGGAYIIGHNYHGHDLHAGDLSLNNYVRENKVREVNVREK